VSTSRRAVLAAGITVGATGALFILQSCSSDTAPASSSDATPSDADAAVRASAITAELALIAEYERALASRSEPQLLAIRDEHVAHLSALDAGEAVEQESADDDTGTRSPVVVADLRDRERTAADQGRARCTQATSPELIRLLTFIAASEASHVPALGRLA
jgi:hypothetical protein